MNRRQFCALAAWAPAAAAAPASEDVFRGITVMPEYIQNEGIDGVLENLIGRAKVNAVATSPYVMAPASESDGSREPPIDAGAGSVRLLDRPLWGERQLFVRTAPSFTPDRALYRGLRYQPPPASDLTAQQGGIVRDFLREAKRRGLKTYLQVQAAIPPGYRVQFGGPAEDDLPRLPDGRLMERRVANNGSLASPHIRAYHNALLKDLAAAYPEITGIRVDWPEYPPYFLDDAFLDFSEHAGKAAAEHGIDFLSMRDDTQRLYERMNGLLSPRDLSDSDNHGLLRLMAAYPGSFALLRLKAQLVEDLLRGFRESLPREMELMPNAFPPPLSTLSGTYLARVEGFCSSLSVKLYTMHWPMMIRFWADHLRKANPKLKSEAIARAVENWLELCGLQGRRDIGDFHYPEPDEPHPVSGRAIEEKITVARRAYGDTKTIALGHGYGPVPDFKRRLRIAWKASNGRVWVNRYGYLSDAKLEAIGDICQ